MITGTFATSEFPAQYFFDRPAVAEPGKVFNYNSGGSHLLSVTSIMLPVKLPLRMWNINCSSRWESIIRGTNGSRTQPVTLWVERSGVGACRHAALRPTLPAKRRLGYGSGAARGMGGRIHRPQMPVSKGINYGYHGGCVQTASTMPSAGAGQQIIILPKQDMVVVFTAGIPRCLMEYL